MTTSSDNNLPTLYQQYIHLSRYSRFKNDVGRRETWDETVNRYFDFFTLYIKDNCNYSLTSSELKLLKNGIINLEVMPSMRCLMTAGEALKRENIAGYNCSYVAIKTPRAFDEILYILMNGCFDKNTLIKTKSGDKPISEISINDLVLSYDVDENRYEYINPRRVIPTAMSVEMDKVELKFEDGSIVYCTADHEFYTTNRGWVQAKDLTENDDIENYFEHRNNNEIN